MALSKLCERHSWARRWGGTQRGVTGGGGHSRGDKTGEAGMGRGGENGAGGAELLWGLGSGGAPTSLGVWGAHWGCLGGRGTAGGRGVCVTYKAELQLVTKGVEFLQALVEALQGPIGALPVRGPPSPHCHPPGWHRGTGERWEETGGLLGGMGGSGGRLGGMGVGLGVSGMALGGTGMALGGTRVYWDGIGG